jgi:integrase
MWCESGYHAVVERRVPSPKRARGEIEDLASGALRVKVYAGIDPISKKRLYLRETVPAGPNARRLAERARTRLLNEVYERRNPRTDATVAQLIDRHIAEAKLGLKTRKNYRGQADKHILPCIGHQKVRAVDAAISDSFYAELRRCRDHCDGRPRTDHRTAMPHDCDARCKPHACRPLKETSVLYIHQILSGAFRRAVRLQWVTVNPFDSAEPRPASRPKPRPPTAADAARIVTEAWTDPDWGTLIWLTMVAGNRRGDFAPSGGGTST